MPKRTHKEAAATRRRKAAALDEAALQETLARSPPRLVRVAGMLRRPEPTPGEVHPKDLHQEAQKARAIRVGKMLKFEKPPTPLSPAWQKLMDFLKPFWTSEHHAEAWELYKHWTRVADADAPTLEELAAKAGMSAQDWIATTALRRIRQYVDGHSHLRAVRAPADADRAPAAPAAAAGAVGDGGASTPAKQGFVSMTDAQVAANFRSYKTLNKFLLDHLSIRTYKPLSARTGKPDPHRRMVHLATLIECKNTEDESTTDAWERLEEERADNRAMVIEERKRPPRAT